MKEFKCISVVIGEVSNFFTVGNYYKELRRNNVGVTLGRGQYIENAIQVSYSHLYRCFEEQGITITEEQAKQLPADVLKVVAPHLIDRSVDVDRILIVQLICTTEGNVELNDDFDWTLEGNILTPLKKI